MLFGKKSKEEQLKDKYNRKIQRKKLKDQIKSIQVNTYTKALVGLITITALIDLQLSYVLAFFDKVQIAEELSKQVCTTILGVSLVYMIRAYFDTKADIKNASNNKIVEKSIISKISGVLSDAGINIDLDSLLNRSNDEDSKDDSEETNDL